MQDTIRTVFTLAWRNHVRSERLWMSALPNKLLFNKDFIKLHFQIIKKEGSCYWPNYRFESLPNALWLLVFTNICSSFVALKIKPTIYLIQYHNFNVFKHCSALESHILVTGNTDDLCLSCWTLSLIVIYESPFKILGKDSVAYLK